MKEISYKRLYERYLVVRLSLEGHSFVAICEAALAKPSASIGRTTKSMVLLGWKWITPPDNRRSSRSTSSNRSVWALKRTLPLVAEWIKREFSITMSVRKISAMLNE